MGIALTQLNMPDSFQEYRSHHFVAIARDAWKKV